MHEIRTELGDYFKRIRQEEDFLLNLVEKNQILILPVPVKDDLDDFFELLGKLKELQKTRQNIKLAKITLEEIDGLLNQITVIKKILQVFMEEKSYSASSDVILQFYKLTGETLLEIPVVMDYNLIGLGRSTVNDISSDSLKTTCLLINQQKFSQLVIFSKTNFISKEFTNSLKLNDCDRWIDSIFTLLSYITKELPYDTLFTNNNYLVNKAIQLLKDFLPNILAIKNLREYGFFLPMIPEIEEKLSLLKEKILKSGRKDYSISNFDTSKYGLAQLQELIETLFSENKKTIA